MPFINETHPLDTGEAFPSLSFKTLRHGTLEIPGSLRDKWGIVLIYRGEW